MRIRRVAWSIVMIGKHVADHVEGNIKLVPVGERDTDGAEGIGLGVEDDDRPALHVMLTDTERDWNLRTGSRKNTEIPTLYRLGRRRHMGRDGSGAKSGVETARRNDLLQC